jgi:PAS domain S-box-containing protein
MRAFTNLPFKLKLNWIIMLTSSVALLLACAAFATYEVLSFRRSMPTDLNVLAQIIGDNGKSALEFNDPKFAEETLLASLTAHPHIMAAGLYSKDGKLFAKFLRRDMPNRFTFPGVRLAGHYFAENHLGLFHPIVSEGKVVGAVYLQSDLRALYARISSYVGICILVLLAALVAAWLLSFQLQGVISGPILKLAETTAFVAREKNYSVRVIKQSEDELGSLFDGFNEMLAEIERRDAALQQAHSELEKRVAQRTGDLTRANQSLTGEVSERMRAEVALRVSQQKFETLVNSIEGLVWEADPKTFEFTFVSQQAERLLGYPRQQWLSEPTFWRDHLHPDDRQRAMQFFQEAVAQNKSHHFEYRMIAADGRVVWIRDSASVVLESDQPVLLRGVLLDITEQKQAEEAMENLNKKLIETSRHAGMAEVATGVLHNVGNVLNSVNVSATLVCDRIRQSRTAGLTKMAALLREHEAELAEFLTTDSRGKMVPSYLNTLAEHLATEQAEILKELGSLTKNIEHIKDIVTMQQSYAKVSGIVENLPLTELLEDALRINAAGLARHGVQVLREFEEVPPVAVDKHKVLQILVNLMQNAKYAMDDARREDKRLIVGISQSTDRVRISVKDNGVGIKPENLTRIFSHGFTTRKNGHGFGLHSGALAAKEMGGSLSAHSDGPGTGATFVLELPRAQMKEAA